MDRTLARRLFAELLGSAFLAAIVIGSGIAAQKLSPNDVGLQLLYNSVATAAGLFAIILMFGPISGAHFNPVVSLVDASFGGLSRREALAYIPAQITGCILGAIIANVMFAVAAISISTKHRATPAHLSSEVIATLGLLLVIFSLARTKRGNMAPAAVGAYIGAAYWFTSSTSFANPAISIGRMFSNTFAGIAPAFSSWVRRRGAGRRRGRDRRAESALSGHHARRGRGGGHATRRGSRARRHTARTRSRKHRGIEEGRAASRCDPGPPARPASAHWRDDALVIGTGACRPALSLAVDLLCHSGDDRRAGHLHRDARCESEIAALSN